MAKIKSKSKITVREFVQVEHKYDQSERNELTRTLTSAVQDKAEQSERLKSVSADFKARIKTADAAISEATNKITNGYEMRQVEASVDLDRKTGVKKLYFHAPGQKNHKTFIREESMTEEDYAKLPLDIEPEKPKDEKKPKARKRAKAEPVSGEPVETPESSSTAGE